MNLKYEDLPDGWVVCFLNQCPRKETCLRYKGGMLLPDNIHECNSVTPIVLKLKSCPCFQEIETIRVALGFKNIFREVKARHAPRMRAQMMQYLHGNGTYYRYYRGEKALSPKQQIWIKELFRTYGYTQDIEFDDYKDTYRFFDD